MPTTKQIMALPEYTNYERKKDVSCEITCLEIKAAANETMKLLVFKFSKGEKVEILWPSATYDELTMMVFGNAPIWEMHENPWDPIPGELPIRMHPDYDLGVPYTYFEYEMDSRIHHLMTTDQMMIPENERPFPSEKNPHCSKEIWRPQEDLKEEDEFRDPNWYPKDTYYNIYNKRDFKRESDQKALRESKSN